MVGVKRFDEVGVVDAAMRLFWAEGYAPASIDAIERTTGLKRGSLYNAFGSKEGLFLRALARYATVEEAWLRALSAEPLCAGIGAALASQRAVFRDRDTPPGCLIAGSLTEPGLDGGPGKALAKRQAETAAAVRERFEAAAQRGELGADFEPAPLAAFFLATFRMLANTDRTEGTAAALALSATAEALFRGTLA